MKYPMLNRRQSKEPKKVLCPVCDGTKIDPENPSEPCKGCNGTGEVTVTLNSN